jgi:hypothetical protein
MTEANIIGVSNEGDVNLPQGKKSIFSGSERLNRKRLFDLPENAVDGCLDVCIILLYSSLENERG